MGWVIGELSALNTNSRSQAADTTELRRYPGTLPLRGWAFDVCGCFPPAIGGNVKAPYGRVKLACCPSHGALLSFGFVVTFWNDQEQGLNLPNLG